jgi:hypothetical protein
MSSNFVSNGYRKLKKEIKKSIAQKYESDLKKASFFERIQIKRRMKIEVKMELLKLKKQITPTTLFFKK